MKVLPTGSSKKIGIRRGNLKAQMGQFFPTAQKDETFVYVLHPIFIIFNIPYSTYSTSYIQHIQHPIFNIFNIPYSAYSTSYIGNFVMQRNINVSISNALGF